MFTIFCKKSPNSLSTSKSPFPSTLRFSQFSILFILVKAMYLQCSDSAPLYPTVCQTVPPWVALFWPNLYSRADEQARYFALKENCLLIKRPTDSACQPGIGRREKLVAAICVLMGSHKGSGAATLRGDKRILWGGSPARFLRGCN